MTGFIFLSILFPWDNGQEEDWQRVAYPVSAGVHTYKWWYVTDISILEGSNAGWVDNIIFPSPPLPVSLSRK